VKQAAEGSESFLRSAATKDMPRVQDKRETPAARKPRHPMIVGEGVYRILKEWLDRVEAEWAAAPKISKANDGAKSFITDLSA
jgi:hypothetical protein